MRTDSIRAGPTSAEHESPLQTHDRLVTFDPGDARSEVSFVSWTHDNIRKEPEARRSVCQTQVLGSVSVCPSVCLTVGLLICLSVCLVSLSLSFFCLSLCVFLFVAVIQSVGPFSCSHLMCHACLTASCPSVSLSICLSALLLSDKHSDSVTQDDANPANSYCNRLKRMQKNNDE